MTQTQDTEPVTQEAQTLDSVRRQIRALENRIRCIRSNMQYVELVRAEREYRRDRDRYAQKLHRLQYKRTHGKELLQLYRDRIEALTVEYDVLRQREDVIKMLRLVREVNSMQGVETQAHPVLDDAEATRDRMLEIRGLVSAYRGEIDSTRRAMAGDFEQQEARWSAAVERADRRFADLVADKTHGFDRIDDCKAQIAGLRQQEAVLSQHVAVDTLFNLLSGVDTLMKELTPEQIAWALK